MLWAEVLLPAFSVKWAKTAYLWCGGMSCGGSSHHVTVAPAASQSLLSHAAVTHSTPAQKWPGEAVAVKAC